MVSTDPAPLSDPSLLFRDAAPLSAGLALVLVAVATIWGSRARC